MRLILIGCEYVGTTTLAGAISDWAQKTMGGNFGFHDHWKVPFISHGEMSDEEQEQFLALSPSLKESFQRYHAEYHLSSTFYGDTHHNSVGFHIDEAVYAPMYYGYGGAGEYADRVQAARRVEAHIMEVAPDTVLILLKASPDVIRSRMKGEPRQNSLVQDEDVEQVLQRFEEEYENSMIRKKFILDTSSATVEETLVEFVENIEPHVSEADQLRILSHRSWDKV